jgi:hypothetical protein
MIIDFVKFLSVLILQLGCPGLYIVQDRTGHNQIHSLRSLCIDSRNLREDICEGFGLLPTSRLCKTVA